MNDNTYEASSENTTDSASGVNRYLETPNRNVTGKNTMQIASVAMVRGRATSREPSRMATVSGLPSVRLRWMFSTATVASSTRMPVASASPPSVIRLMVLPVKYRQMIPANIEQGIEVTTTMVLRQLPRNTRIIRETSPAAMMASDATFLIAARTNTD